MRSIFKCLFIGCILCLSEIYVFGQTAININNPVLPGVADAGVIKFNGEYYIGGVFTNGSFYSSSDLVKWEGPVHVFSMDNEWTDGPSADDSQIHANDISYINGTFHHYWSVNYWGKDQHVVHIGHATSPNVLGPYDEPVKDTWLANRIDPHLFIDDDRKLYLYMVKFTDGNTIWGRPMKDPGTFSGEPRYLFASLPGTWETLDNRVAEGPWVINYRNRYYMMYNTNHTSPRWGNYTLGVAEANDPLGFNHGSKYPWPVVKSNQLDMEAQYVDLLKFTGSNPAVFSFTTEKPDRDWYKSSFDASGWEEGKSGFGSRVIEGSTTRQVKTDWDAPELWVRKTFTFKGDNGGNLMLRIHHDGTTKVFLNGQPIYEKEGDDYINWNFDRKASNLLNEGENVLAIHTTKGKGANFLDVSLFNMQGQQGDDILYSPGQPNILRGPNGFEWWLIYMANKNAERRGQYINRIHFFNKRLFVDGITDQGTPGYHPKPAQPTFGALFNDADSKQWLGRWDLMGGNWELKNKEVIQIDPGNATAMVKSIPAANYLFEAGVKMNNKDTKAGVVAWWKDKNNWLKIVLDQKQKKWGYLKNVNGKSEAVTFPLPSDFDYNVYHKVSVYKNAADFKIKIDDLPAPQNHRIRITEFSDKGRAGIFTEGANTAFDGILYTVGWDEFDETITGWGASANGTEQKGSWTVSEEGLKQSDLSGEQSIFKGDLLEGYEISAQVTAGCNEGSAGIYPVYTDADNYLKAAFDLKNQKLIISGKRNGKDTEAKEVSLERSQSYYADMKYTDFREKHFNFHAASYIDAIKFNKTPHNRQNEVIEDIYKKVDIFYKAGGKWYPLKDFKEAPSSHPGFDEITFDPIEMEALKFVNKGPEDRAFYIYQIWVNEIFKTSYHLNVAKRDEAVIFLVDGKEVARVANNFSASQVGLFTSDSKASFNGITFYHLNTNR